MSRVRLPNRRGGVRFDLTHDGMKYFVMVGFVEEAVFSPEQLEEWRAAWTERAIALPEGPHPSPLPLAGEGVAGGGCPPTAVLRQAQDEGLPPTASSPIEVFISAEKTASGLEALARDAAILISLALQHGAPLDELRRAITRGDHGEAATVTGAVLDAMAAL